jgi:16S rRNA (uracil1498-N3)-methyltransferase
LQLPYFYIESFDDKQKTLILDEVNSRHAVQVLRLKNGAQLHLTDGKGNLITATIAEDNKKHCGVIVNQVDFFQRQIPQLAVAISLIKNINRFEWFLEKATELGVQTIVPLICERTEKQKVKEDRWHNILVSAMLQSRQVWLPEMDAAMSFEEYLRSGNLDKISDKYIAHCADGEKQKLLPSSATSALILIGPEGDFTSGEINIAFEKGCKPVSLGTTRLRTETAGIAAAAAFLLHSS